MIVSIPDLCTLAYYGSDLCLSKNFVMHSLSYFYDADCSKVMSLLLLIHCLLFSLCMGVLCFVLVLLCII